jgi:hypothetical protein
MPALKNIRHEAFANLIAQAPKTRMSNAACYREAGYRVAAGPTCDAAASRLLSSDKVQARIAELIQPAVKKARITVESLLSELEATIGAAREAKQFGAVNGSLALIGKLTGLLRDRLEVGQVGEFDGCSSPEEIVDKWISSEGSAQAVLDMIDAVRAHVVERAANEARPINEPAERRSRPSESAMALQLLRPGRRTTIN